MLIYQGDTRDVSDIKIIGTTQNGKGTMLYIPSPCPKLLD